MARLALYFVAFIASFPLDTNVPNTAPLPLWMKDPDRRWTMVNTPSVERMQRRDYNRSMVRERAGMDDDTVLYLEHKERVIRDNQGRPVTADDFKDKKWIPGGDFFADHDLRKWNFGVQKYTVINYKYIHVYNVYIIVYVSMIMYI